MDHLKHSGKSLEDAFFMEQDLRLREELAHKREEEHAKQALIQASGIDDEEVLDTLNKMGITPNTLTAFSLVPMVAVAWADRVLDHEERAAILKAAHAQGVCEGSASYQLLQGWLEKRPQESVFEAWRAYAHALTQSLEGSAREKLKCGIIGRARAVAEASGGFLGLGNKISQVEAKVLDDLERALS